MSNNKQSSVEWLIDQYKKCFGPGIPLIMNNENEKAKAMHKEEIIDAYHDGINLEYHLDMPSPKEYYEQTFGDNNGE